MRLLHDAAPLAPFAGGYVVPTMGALHDGHAALIRQARDLADRPGKSAPVLVTIFVNPTQFGDPADLARYPRTIDADLRLCESAGADAVFAPEPGTVYPRGTDVPIPSLPAVATTPHLEDAARPGHFAGVCQVVLRLFSLLRPRAALFGEKDWQQLQVVSSMVEHERLDVRIIPVPTVRESDGLAMSSRNRFLSAHDRARARALSRALHAGAGATTADSAEHLMLRTLTDAGIAPDYAVVRDAATLLPLSRHAAPLAQVPGQPLRALIAARVGPVRLIDNAPWPAPHA